MKAEWVDGFEIRVTAEKGETVISANREGMLSLAKQLRMLSPAMSLLTGCMSLSVFRNGMSATGMQRTPGGWIFICLNFFFKNRIPC